MDNLAHSLVGAWMGEAGLKRKTPLATLTLVLGANLPDIDGITVLGNPDTSLLLRRESRMECSPWPCCRGCSRAR